MAKKEMTKAEKFVELAEKRMTKCINDLRSLRKLANANAYEYSDKQVKQILEGLQNECNGLAADFKAGKVSGATGFKLA